MKQVYQILAELRETGSTKEKQAILSRNRDNVTLKEYLKATYDTGINYYFTGLKESFKVPDSPFFTREEGDWTSIKILLNKLSSRTLSGNAARSAVEALYASITPETCEMMQWLFKRDIRAGCSVSTISKVWPDLIEKCPYMRCNLTTNVDVTNWPWANGVYAQTKMDGMFCNVIMNGDSIRIVSRNNSPFPLDFFTDIVADAWNIKNRLGENIVLNGELLVKKDGKYLSREVGNGMLNTVLQEGEFEPGCSVELVVWDFIPYASYVKGEYDTIYTTRFNVLSFNINNLESIKLCETVLCYSFEEAIAYYQEKLAEGEEGAVIKHPLLMWKNGTSDKQIKLKVVFEIDLEIVGFNPGNGQHADTFGSMQTRTADKLLETNISGFKLDMRKKLSDNRDDYIGKIVTVRANGIMKPNEDTGISRLFLPRFVEIRHDKTTADTLPEVQAQYNTAIGMAHA